MLYKHILAKSHSGVIGQFLEKVVRMGIISISDFRVYAKLLNLRSKGDYNDLFDYTSRGRRFDDGVDKELKHFVSKCINIEIIPIFATI